MVQNAPLRVTPAPGGEEVGIYPPTLLHTEGCLPSAHFQLALREPEQTFPDSRTPCRGIFRGVRVRAVPSSCPECRGVVWSSSSCLGS